VSAVEITYAAQEFHLDQVTGETSQTGQVYTLAFDAVVKEKHGAQATLTEHAVEGGAALSDHKQVKLRTVTLDCVVTDSPLGAPPPTGSRTRQVRGTVTNVELGEGRTAQGLVYSAPVTRVVDAFAELEDLVRRPVTVAVRTGLRLYSRMQVTSVSAPRALDDGNSIELSIELTELRTATVETTTVPQPRMARNRDPVDDGNPVVIPAPTVNVAEDSGLQSVLHHLAS
jgi:hypothetical protein